MNRKLTYRKKFLYLRIFLVLFLYVGYEIALKETIDIKKQVNRIDKQLNELSEAPQQIAELQQKLNRLDGSVENLFYNQQSVQDLMLEQVTAYCSKNNILIKDFPKAKELKKADYTIKTDYLVLEGTFQKLLVLLYNIEQKYKLGIVSSARFFTSVNSKTKMPKLYMELIIQNIETHEK